MTTIQVSKTSLLFSELIGSKTDTAELPNATNNTGIFQSLLAGMHDTKVNSSEGSLNSKEHQVPHDERAEENLDVVQESLSLPIDNLVNNESHALIGNDQVDNALVQNPKLMEKDLPRVERTSLPNLLFESQPKFEGGFEKKIIPLPTPIISVVQMQSLAKWSVNKVAEKQHTSMEGRLVLDPITSVSLDTDTKLVLDSKTSFDVHTNLNSDMELEIKDVSVNELDSLMKKDVVPELPKPVISESNAAIPLQAPEWPVEFQQGGVESFDVSKPEFEKFRFEFAKNLTVPLRQAITDGGQTLRIQVFPENLGHIDIVVSMQEGKMHAQLTASSTVTKEVLEMQLPQLRQSLQEQGIQLEQLEVELFGEEGFERDRPNYQPGTEQNNSKNNSQTEWSEEVDEVIELDEENTSQTVDYSV